MSFGFSFGLGFILAFIVAGVGFVLAVAIFRKVSDWISSLRDWIRSARYHHQQQLGNVEPVVPGFREVGSAIRSDVTDLLLDTCLTKTAKIIMWAGISALVALIIYVLLRP